ncbi:fluconazole resistance protein 1 [Melanomma pulvis-pyrius CBS 109.77]|uniref:Fluconazole resistance protein 1 n=1 Tax=Melanomma pulvis-pyrius CBS 109.77 TaxID=1314802 RepID=A0A6A6XV40_9PLEO|nr:fluconazole resistance protein 1 [Melanomma pulvis-pyrius CBS 109.77]
MASSTPKDPELVLLEKESFREFESSVSSFSVESVVDFEGPDDPADPYNWSPLYKWTLVILISFLSLVVNLAILMCAPATSQILKELHSTNKLHATILVSIWELGEVVGPFLLAPLSEIYGRLPVFHSFNIMFILFAVGAALSKNMETLIAMRFFLGLSVASTILNPCIVGDMFREEERGRALGIMGMIPFIAPVLGPTVGGLISQAKGWRWTFWLIVIIASPLQLLFSIIYRESYRVRILERKAESMRKRTGNSSLRSRYEVEKRPILIIKDAVFRPILLLIRSRAVLLVGLCSALNMSLVYVVITSLGTIYDERYHIRKDLLGLTYLGLGFGMIIGVQLCGQFLDRYLQRKIKSGNGKPEHRLPPMVLGSVLVPLGLLAFGWAVQEKAHWIIPIVFSSFVGFGFVANSIAAWSYLVDAFGIYSASATAGNIVLRNAASAALPLAGPALSVKLGYGWAYTVLALIGLLAVPISLVLWRLGERIRIKDSIGRITSK